MIRARRCLTFGIFVALVPAAACRADRDLSASPMAASRTSGDVGVDGASLKASAPIPLFPLNGATVGGSFATLTATPATLKYVASAAPLSHQFELYDSAGLRVQSETIAGAAWAVSNLRFDSRYSWRARGMLGGTAGPWSSVASFLTPPPSWVVSGRIVAGPEGPAVPGARVQVDGLPAVITDAAGRYAIGLNDGAIRRVTITANDFLPRETYLRGNENRTCVDLDLIPAAATFALQYQEMAHNAKDLPLAPIRRWTTRPNFSVVTTWKDTTEPVDPAVITFTIGLIRQYVPVWTAGQLEAGEIEIIPAWRPPDRINWISVYWVHDGFRGMAGTGSNPGFMHFNSATTREPATIIHELGHSMGFHHTSTSGFVMGPHQLTQTVLPDAELRIARILYSRPPGNRQPDVDPPDIFIHMPAGPGARTSCAPF